jgi:hypothetical protein
MFNGTNVKLFKPFKLQVVEVTGRSLAHSLPASIRSRGSNDESSC